MNDSSENTTSWQNEAKKYFRLTRLLAPVLSLKTTQKGNNLLQKHFEETAKMNRDFQKEQIFRAGKPKGEGSSEEMEDEDTINLGDIYNVINDQQRGGAQQQKTGSSFLPLLLTAAIAGAPGAYAAYMLSNLNVPKTELKDGDLITQPPSFGLDGSEIISE